ncbi:hypothetical protein H311_00176, partial [Anncaliia algerae PRA109]
VNKRDSATLNDLILKYVLPGSIVITDGWKGYTLFKENINFAHHWVNHSISFVNENGMNTNTIEGTWSGVKRNVPIRCHTKENLQKKLLEFIWRRQNKNILWLSLLDLLKY